jgi:Domain of unknown function DUF29
LTVSSTPVTYDQDFNLWLEQTVNLLRSGQFEQLDIENLVDELESMSRRDKREILSRLKVVLMHLLKWKYQPEQRSGSWESSIRTNRDEIAQILIDSPSLKNYPTQVLTHAYPIARKNAASETGLVLGVFPDSSPFSIAQVLDDEFWPEA